ncbi:MAG: hypothetical protein A2V79_12485 [Betaproteobacteria bacterium RBG_16_56_24]|nr:MAG: hypothetical protein A2V79_12485 [Betaproteobacteria bacterium RBG_16_56_24]
MRNLSMLALVLTGLAAPLAVAAESKVEISSPKDGARLDAMEQNKLVYNITPGGAGDHMHVYVDGKETALLRQMKGSHTLETLAPGKHEICIKIVNKNHTPIGVERCIKVTAE